MAAKIDLSLVWRNMKKQKATSLGCIIEGNTE